MEHDNKALKNLREHLEKEIEALVTSKPSLTPTEVSNAKEAVCLIQKIDEVVDGSYKYDDETSGGMPRMHYPHHGYSYGWEEPHMYDSESGRMRHYSGSRGRDASTGRYVSRDGRTVHDMMYSGHSIEDRVISKLEEMMDTAKSDYERQRLNQFIRVVESMIGE